jgi:hypothetical protein
MIVPEAERRVFYGSNYTSAFPFEDFDSYESKPREHQGALYVDTAYGFVCLAVACMDLGRPTEEARGWLGASLVAHYEGIRRTPTKAREDDPMFASFIAGVHRDEAAFARHAEAWEATPLGTQGEDYTDCTNPHFLRLSRVLVARTRGAPALEQAMESVRTAPPWKGSKKGLPFYEGCRDMLIDAVAAPAPDPLPFLKRLAPRNGKSWWDFYQETFLAQRPVGLAVVARDRGWIPPDKDPHPSMPMALLRLPPRPIVFGPLPRPSAELREQILARYNG